MHNNVDHLSPMVPATQQPAEKANPLVKGMKEPPPEPQPAAETSLWQRVRDGFTLDEHQEINNKRIKRQRDWYANHQAYMERVANRSQRYLYYITKQIEKRKMPTELALLPVVESAYDPFAYSRGHASGPWQFIPSTAKYFGLENDWWYDGRRDIIASTDAALTYLQKLANRFDGNWLLALASYNAGAGTVSRAIRRNKARNLPTDFWHLHLPRETRAYVPKLLAVAQLVNNPKKYGITLPAIPNTAYFSIVKIEGQIDLSKAAEMAGISVQELYMLNPGFNRWATPPKGPHRLLIPVKHESAFKEALAALPADQRVSWTRYIIRPGDSLLSISHQQQVPLRTLRRVNHITGNRIVAGHTLLIPRRKSDSYASALKKTLTKHHQPSGKRISTYRVRPGDSLWTIAMRHHVSLHDLMAWNGLSRRSTLHPGQKLRLYGGRSGKPSTYRVKKGDSLWSIAQRYKVSMNHLMQWNGLSKTSILRPGQSLKLYSHSGAAKTASIPASASVYTVKKGDSLWAIAHHSNTSVSDLKKWNHLHGKVVLHPGQELLLQGKKISKKREKSGENKRVNYLVKQGDSLYAIAHQFDVSVADLRSWNQISGKKYLHPGEELTVYVGNNNID